MAQAPWLTRWALPAACAFAVNKGCAAGGAESAGRAAAEGAAGSVADAPELGPAIAGQRFASREAQEAGAAAAAAVVAAAGRSATGDTGPLAGHRA